MSSSYQQSENIQFSSEELLKPLPTKRLLFNNGMTALALILSAIALIPLASIIWEILARGISGLRFEMFYQEVTVDGFANAIVGTIIMVAIASLLSIPAGILTGIYLSEVGKRSKLARAVKFVIRILTGVPSIVVGVFAYAVLVFSTKQYSAVAGGFALAVIMLPIVALTTEEALKLIPTAQRLASAALGGNLFQTTTRVVVAAAIPGITTGVLLAVARATGETAPLLFTALFSFGWSEGLFSPTASLPVLIYNLYSDPDPQKNALVWTASIILVGMVLFISLLSRLFTSKRRK
jgi:phosphate transport system permease protein